MSEEQLERILAGVPVTRRAMVKRMVLGTAFAVPVLASFRMNTAMAGKPTTSNQTAPDYCITPNQDGTGGEYETAFIEESIRALIIRTDSVRPQSLNATARRMLDALNQCDIAKVKSLKTKFDGQLARALARDQLTQSQYDGIKFYADYLDHFLLTHGGE